MNVEVEKEQKELKLQRQLPTPLTESALQPIKVRKHSFANFTTIFISFSASMVERNVLGSIR